MGLWSRQQKPCPWSHSSNTSSWASSKSGSILAWPPASPLRGQMVPRVRRDHCHESGRRGQRGVRGRRLSGLREAPPVLNLVVRGAPGGWWEYGGGGGSQPRGGGSRTVRSLWSPSGRFHWPSGVSFCHVTLRSGSEGSPRGPLDGDAALVLEILLLLYSMIKEHVKKCACIPLGLYGISMKKWWTVACLAVRRFLSPGSVPRGLWALCHFSPKSPGLVRDQPSIWAMSLGSSHPTELAPHPWKGDDESGFLVGLCWD